MWWQQTKIERTRRIHADRIVGVDSIGQASGEMLVLLSENSLLVSFGSNGETMQISSDLIFKQASKVFGE